MRINNKDEMINLGYQIGKKLKKSDIVILDGNLASGKTTLTKGIAKGLGISKTINSPTFNICKTYIENDIKLYHIDLYRLEGINNDYDLLDYFNDETSIVVSEWTSNIKELIPNSYLYIKIDYIDENTREVFIKPIGSKYEGRF